MGKWRWLAAVAVTLPQAAPAATGGGPLLHLHEQGADFTVTGGGATENGPGVRGEANLSLDLAGIATNIKSTLNTGSMETMEDGGAAWSGGALNFDTQWQHGGTTLSLKASRAFQHSMHDGIAEGTLTSIRAEQQSDVETAGVTASFQPLDDVTLKLGADAQTALTVQGLGFGSETANVSRVETETGRQFAQASWSPLPAVTLDAGTDAVSGVMALRGPIDGKTAYRAMEPRASLKLKPWGGSEVKLEIRKAITPLNAANFAAYTAASGRPEDASLRPDSARAFNTSLKQTFGPLVSLNATYSNAQLDSTTMLMPAGIGQAPVSITGGRWQSFSTALSFSLAAMGLPKTSITSTSVWRRSKIADPLTGNGHRLSGEVPHDATVRLTQQLPRRHMTLGLEGSLGAETRYYQAAEQSDVTKNGSFGAFVQYDPGPFSLRLNVDGLAGSTVQTDDYFAGSRASGPIDHSVRHDTSGPAIGLSLTTAMDGG